MIIMMSYMICKINITMTLCLICNLFVTFPKFAILYDSNDLYYNISFSYCFLVGHSMWELLP